MISQMEKKQTRWNSCFIFAVVGISTMIAGVLVMITGMVGITELMAVTSSVQIHSRGGGNAYQRTYYEFTLEENQSAALVIFINEIDDFVPLFPENFSVEKSYSEQELIQLSEIFLNYVREDDPYNWTLVQARYHLYDCDRGFNGYTHATFHYETIYPVDDPYTDRIFNRTDTYIIDILPVEMIAISNHYDNTVSEPVNEKVSILQNLSVNAVSALNMVEENGGRETRQTKVHPYCEIILELTDYKKPDWHVWYIGQSGTFYEAFVNDQNGKISVLSK